MAFNAAMASKSPTAASEVFKEHIGLRRTLSGQDLVVKGRGIQRSSSDNHLCYHHSGNTNKNRILAVSIGPGQGLKNSRSVGVFPFQIPNPIKSLLSHPDTFQDEKTDDENETNLDGIKKMNLDSIKKADLDGIKKANWVERLLEIRRQWKKEVKTETLNSEISAENLEEEEGVCIADYGSETSNWERETFSKLLVKASWSEAKKLSQLAYLCNVAYTIPEIKAEDLKKYYGLTFVTSSLEKKAKATILREKLEQDSTRVPVVAITTSEKKKQQPRVSSSASAYKIAASAASYIHSCKEYGYEELGNPVYKSAVAAQAAASTMTAVVAAGEEEKLEAAKELQSLQSSPCEWFVCDDPNTYTRCFVIQGSDSLASWKANLFFEPTKFEDTDVLVHRGIYEAAKGIYEQFLPEITEHVSRHGSDRAKFQFTGHSLGGSLSLIVNLMLLTRGILTIESMKPVVTFGSPFVFCGGEKILEEVLGVEEDHVHCVMMHRDIVPRAFACNYPDHVATVLKRLNGSFRTHPCLNTNKLLYSPMGKVFILQPSESVSPTHPFLPSGNALYVLDKSKETYSPTALRAFLNRPHPLETLSQRAAYGSEGSVLRDHDSKNYVKAVNGVLRQHTKLIVRKVRRQRRSNVWPVLTSAERNMTMMTTATEEIMTRV